MKLKFGCESHWVCRNKCDNMDHRSTRGGYVRLHMLMGFKKCSTCNKMVKSDNFRCPCCNGPLRTRTRYGKKDVKRID